MNTYIATLLIAAATATNTLLAWTAFSYHIIGHGLHPTVAAALGIAIIVKLTTYSLTIYPDIWVQETI